MKEFKTNKADIKVNGKVIAIKEDNDDGSFKNVFISLLQHHYIDFDQKEPSGKGKIELGVIGNTKTRVHSSTCDISTYKELVKAVEEALHLNNTISIGSFARQVLVLPGHPDHPAYRGQIPRGPMPGSQFDIYQPENKETPPGAETLIYPKEDLKGKECCGCCDQCSKHQ